MFASPNQDVAFFTESSKNTDLQNFFAKNTPTKLAFALMDKDQERFYPKQLKIFSSLVALEKNNLPSEYLMELSQKFFFRLSHPKLSLNDRLMGLKQLGIFSNKFINLDNLLADIQAADVKSFPALIAYITQIIPIISISNAEALMLSEAILPWIDNKKEYIRVGVCAALTQLTLKLEEPKQQFISKILNLLSDKSLKVRHEVCASLKTLAPHMKIELFQELEPHLNRNNERICETIWFCLIALVPNFDKKTLERLLERAISVTRDQKKNYLEQWMAYDFIISNIDLLDNNILKQLATEMAPYLIGPIINGVSIAKKIRSNMSTIVEKIEKKDLPDLAEAIFQNIENSPKSVGIAVGIIASNLSKQSLIKLIEKINIFIAQAESSKLEIVFAFLNTVNCLDKLIFKDFLWKIFGLLRIKTFSIQREIYQLLNKDSYLIPLQMHEPLIEAIFLRIAEQLIPDEALKLLVTLTPIFEKRLQEKVVYKIITLINSNNPTIVGYALNCLSQIKPILQTKHLMLILNNMIEYLNHEYLRAAACSWMISFFSQLSDENINQLLKILPEFMHDNHIKMAYIHLVEHAFIVKKVSEKELIQNIFPLLHDQSYYVRESSCNFFAKIAHLLSQNELYELVLNIIPLAKDPYEPVQLEMCDCVLNIIPLLAVNDLFPLINELKPLLDTASSNTRMIAFKLLSAITVHPNNQPVAALDCNELNTAEKMFIRSLTAWVSDIKEVLFANNISMAPKMS